MEKICVQVIGAHPERRTLQLDLHQVMYASFSQEATVGNLKDAIISLLAQTSDFDFRDKYTFGVISFQADGRNKKDTPDPDPQYFALAVLDDLSDAQKNDIIAEEFPDKSELERVQYFDTIKESYVLLSIIRNHNNRLYTI